jgi:hypothetical protein
VVFTAYLRQHVSRLLAQRLASLPGPVLEDSALELCARKVANGNGDMRRALEAAAQALDIAAERRAEAAAAEAAGGAGPSAPPRRLVGLREMASALARVTGGMGATNDNVAAIRALPAPQQLIMAAVGKMLGDSMASQGIAIRLPPAPGAATTAARFIGGGGGAILANPGLAAAPGRRLSGGGGGGDPASARRSKEVTLAELEAAHVALCRAVGVAPYTSGEFATAADLLCTLGLVEMGGGGGGERRRQRVLLRVPEDDVLLALADVPVLKHVVGA